MATTVCLCFRVATIDTFFGQATGLVMKWEENCSFELGAGVDVALERAVVDIGAVIVKEWHHGLVLRTVPLDVARLPQPVPVHILVVLVVDRGLASSPLAVRIRSRRTPREDTADGPVEEVWVVHQRLGVPGVIVEDYWSIF